MNDNIPIAHDMLRGADKIAGFLGMERRQIYHLAEKTHLPVFKIGATLCARKSTLLAWIVEQEQRGWASMPHAAV
ncbi:MAG: DNA-binding protein [Alphaproteobacteria bacterium]|nr:DNA-binding protein [Alphaproteobacteria bacterium]